jgi:RNase H-fold protein (predicted Holliday junction resolvase)
MEAGSERFIGIDPGRSKCGVAVVDGAGKRHALGVVPTETLAQSLAVQASAGPIAAICVGDATTSAAVIGLCKAALPGVPIEVVDESRTTLEARQRYYQDHPPRGLMRLIPRGLLVPNEPLDGYAALLIVERFLSQKSR